MECDAPVKDSDTGDSSDFSFSPPSSPSLLSALMGEQ